MSEMTFLHLMGWVSMAAVAVPLLGLVYSLWREAFSDAFVVLDENGKVLGEISAESVRHDPKEISDLHKRIRQSEHVIVRAAA